MYQGTQLQLLSTPPLRGLVFSYVVFPTPTPIIHMRLDSIEKNWVGVGIGGAASDAEDGMKGFDMWVAYQKNGAWEMEDQWGTGRSLPSGAESQDLQSVVIWQPSETSLSVQFSRALNTVDAAHDVNITGLLNLNFAIGNTPTYAVHNADDDNPPGAGVWQVNLLTTVRKNIGIPSICFPAYSKSTSKSPVVFVC